MTGQEIFRAEGGKPAEIWHQEDDPGMPRQLGLEPPPTMQLHRSRYDVRLGCDRWNSRTGQRDLGLRGYHTTTEQITAEYPTVTTAGMRTAAYCAALAREEPVLLPQPGGVQARRETCPSSSSTATCPSPPSTA